MKILLIQPDFIFEFDPTSLLVMAIKLTISCEHHMLLISLCIKLQDSYLKYIACVIHKEASLLSPIVSRNMNKNIS